MAETASRKEIRPVLPRRCRCRWTASSPGMPPTPSHPVSHPPAAKVPPRNIGEGPLTWEPPIGIEPMTYSLRVNRSTD
jgi:hypothetical protein